MSQATGSTGALDILLSISRTTMLRALAIFRTLQMVGCLAPGIPNGELARPGPAPDVFPI